MVRWLSIASLLFACHDAFRPAEPAQVDFDLAAELEPLNPSVVYTPAGPIARSYGERPPGQGAADPMTNDAFARVSELATHSLVRDRRLDLAAGELAKLTAEGVDLTNELVAFALRARGMFEPAKAIAVSDLASLEAALGENLERLKESQHPLLGLGASEHGYVVLIVYPSPVEFTVAPFVVTGGVTITGALADGFRHTHATITRGDNRHEAARLRISKDGRFELDFRCDGHAGIQWLALEAAEDPHPFAVLPISCGESMPSAYRIEPRANLRAVDRAARLRSMINRERVAAGLLPLRSDSRAEAAAQAYVRFMSSRSSVSLGLGGLDSMARMRAAGRDPAASSETALEADSFDLAVEALWNNPRYWAALTDPAMTHVGLAIANTRSGSVLVAIECLQIPIRVDNAAVTATVEAALASLEHPADDELREVAVDYARYLAIGWSAHSAESVLGRRLRKLGRDHCQTRRGGARVAMKIAIRNLTDVPTFEPSRLADNVAAGSLVGVGVSQSARSGLLSGRIWVVAIFGHCVR